MINLFPFFNNLNIASCVIIEDIHFISESIIKIRRIFEEAQAWSAEGSTLPAQVTGALSIEYLMLTSDYSAEKR